MDLLLLALVILSALLALQLAAGTGWSPSSAAIAASMEKHSDACFDEAAVPDYTLPDPLVAADGTSITTPEAWAARREELLDTFAGQVYGRLPGEPDAIVFEITHEDYWAIDGVATLKQVRIISEHEGREHEFDLTLFIPNDQVAPAPVLLLMTNRGVEHIDPTREHRSAFWPVEDAIGRGYAIAATHNRQLAPDDAARYTQGIVRLFEGEREPADRASDAFKAIAAWGWGASRAMDYFEADERVDHHRVAVAGHSRGGKAALWAGARDTRFALTISNESGCAGAAISRRRFGETVARITERFPHWFCDNFHAYAEREDELPIDQHALIGLVAPRAVYVASADGDLWSDPRGEFLAFAHASPVYQLWGHEPIDPHAMPALDTPLIVGPRGYHIRQGEHDLNVYDWHRFMDFADGVMSGEQ